MSAPLRLPPYRLQTRLLLLATMAVLPSLAVIVGTEWIARQHVLDTTIDESRRLASVAAAQQATIFVDTEKLLRTLAAARIDADDDHCNATVDEVHRDHAAQRAIFVLDAAGRVVCPRRSATNAYADRGWFQAAVRTRRLAVGEYQVSRFFHTGDIVMALPHVDGHGVDRVYAASLDLAALAHVAAMTQGPPGAVLTLLDRRDTIVMRYPDDTGKWIGQRTPRTAAMVRIRGGAAEDVREDVGIDGVLRLWTTVPIAMNVDAGLVLAFGIPHDVAFAPANDLLRRSAVLLLMVIATTIVVAWATGHVFVLHPIGVLTDVIQRLANGDLAARAHLASAMPGLDTVTDAINQMADALQGRQLDQAQLHLLAHAIESTNDMVSVTDVDNRITFANAAFLRTYGYAIDEVLGQTPALLQPANTPAALVRDIVASTRNGGWHGELVNRRKDGSLLTISLDTSPVCTSEGAIVGLLGIARDVSDRVRAERALRAAEQRLQFALAMSRVGVWERNLYTSEWYWSDIQHELHGLTPGTFAGTIDAFMVCVHPEDRERIRRALTEASPARDVELEYRAVWPNGSERWIRSSAHYVADETGMLSRGAGISVDVTEHRNLEDQLRQAQKMEAIGQLAGGIAHDFNNMLTAILGNAELVLDDLDGRDPHAHDIAEIRRAAQRAADLTHQLLAFGRKQMLAPTVLHPGAVVDQVTPMVQRLIGETIQLRTVVGNRHAVKADPTQLEQVLVNLSVNARDAMPNGGVLAIETRDAVIAERDQNGIEPGEYVEIVVRDSGHGMDGPTLARIFEPFFTTKPKGHGTGLGLATVYGIIKQTGGSIVVTSEVGKGTTFTIYLPRTFERPPIDSPSYAPHAFGGRESILLVEDEEAVREFVQSVLHRSGYLVHPMPDSIAALGFADTHANEIDLILTDVVLPDVRGPQLVELIRQRDAKPKVLYMSGYVDTGIVTDGILDGTKAFLAKPFSREALLTRVRQVLDSRDA